VTTTSVAAYEVRRRFAELIDVLVRDGRPAHAAAVADLAVDQGVWVHPLQRPVEFVAGLDARPVHDAREHWFVAHLESRYAAIRAELDDHLRDVDAGVAPAGFAPVDEPLLDTGSWDQVVLYEAGRRQEQACALFPVTAAAVAEIPEATTMGPGVVTLSLLHPGSRVRPHCGRTNAQLRVHLGVRVPRGARMRVGEERIAWEEGRCVVFDDSFEHEVWHDGDSSRLVLLLDVLHPDLSERARQRVLQGRRTVEHQVAAYLADHDLSSVESDERGVVLRPSAGSSALIRRFMTETGAVAAHRDPEGVRFERTVDPVREHDRDTTVDRVREVWQEVLHEEPIGLDDDFFELGGNSLHAVRIAAHLSDDLDLDLSVRSVVECRTIRAMAAHVALAVAEQGDDQR
jgi:aspartate beta-hydroxylase